MTAENASVQTLNKERCYTATKTPDTISPQLRKRGRLLCRQPPTAIERATESIESLVRSFIVARAPRAAAAALRR